MNITLEQATQAALLYLSNLDMTPEGDAVLVDAMTTEYDSCWVFFFQSRLFLETGNKRFALLGNGPLIVDNRTGQVCAGGTARPAEFYVEEFRKSREPRR